ncbi:hypothetical protein F1188_19620 [Roseospira marina]|uniref:Uncharacterized protein n=1 Tax=Roseospira marina TaxID=140057 RepID=A0A5M6I6K6_9PROT|nr:hypothetical protein [Roseospira marina]KAA5603485.1 hypothetical protein F1188_19620 [Roseospira marina]MBB4315487.1 hypothetical protein [Roseospira marina]MBB5088367.1 hypothetical protein [Roseospira marina]
MMETLYLWAPDEAALIAAAVEALPELLDGDTWVVRRPDREVGYPRTADGAVMLDVIGIQPWEIEPVYDSNGQKTTSGVRAAGFHTNLMYRATGEARAQALLVALLARGGEQRHPDTPVRIWAGI